MRALGYSLIALGCLAASFVAVLVETPPSEAPEVVEQQQVSWQYWFPAMAAGVAGVVLVQRGRRREFRQEGRLQGRLETVERSLGNIVTNLSDLNTRRGEIDVYDLRHEIDRLFLTDLDDFVEARESVAHRHGLEAYAELMNCFAAGERYLNRVWCCSTDGYIDEATEYLDRAAEQFGEAVRHVAGLGSASES